MASTLKYITSYVDLQYEIKRRNDLAELSKREKYIAARKIQAWIRGILTRQHLRMLHKKAAIIQCHWRSYQVRKLADRNLMKHVEQMWQDYYDRMARKIQTVWRGYRARKTGVDFRQMRQWLNRVYAKNRELLEDMKKFREKEMERIKNIVDQESMQWILHILFKLHHLLRTKQRPGVITRIDEVHSTSIEEMLKCLEYVFYVSSNKTKCEECSTDQKQTLVFRGTRFERCEKEIRQFEKSVREGRVSISRSEPYELYERARKDRIQLGQTILREQAYDHGFYSCVGTRTSGIEQRSKATVVANGRLHKAPRKTCRSAGKTNLQSSFLDATEIYDMLRQMDCHLKKTPFKCPIHNLPYPS